MSSQKRLITLTSYDGQSFKVEEAVAFQSVMIKTIVDDIGAENPIPISNVSGVILRKVIDYCRKHAEDGKDSKTERNWRFVWPNKDSPLKKWESQFVKVEQKDLFELILAANYLNIKGLMDLACQTVADMVRGKTVEEMRKIFNIKNDYTAEEEEVVRRENAWAFEDLESEGKSLSEGELGI
ncbi:SKP1-like protein 11 [Argentina anserina]|uniref:SKP1-like protein 11 n=1 Tax=Argentina anserina TaxID=57926 RepID=UPI00217633FF|nr:SKP1-like protein 11 [Potentilla anserina]